MIAAVVAATAVITTLVCVNIALFAIGTAAALLGISE